MKVVCFFDKIDINFIDVNAKAMWPFSTFVNQVLKFYPHFACSERLRKFPIKYGDLYICGRGVRKLPVQYWHRNHCCIWLIRQRLRNKWVVCTCWIYNYVKTSQWQMVGYSFRIKKNYLSSFTFISELKMICSLENKPMILRKEEKRLKSNLQQGEMRLVSYSFVITSKTREKLHIVN